MGNHDKSLKNDKTMKHQNFEFLGKHIIGSFFENISRRKPLDTTSSIWGNS